MVRPSSIAARRTTMSYTLAEAAAACGLDKSTIRRAVRSGRISGTRDDLGVWHVEPAELHRVFPPTARPEGDTTAVPRDAPPDAAAVTTDALVAELHRVIADLRTDRDHWRDAFENAQRALPAPQPVEKPLTWWRWLRSTGCFAGVGLLLALATATAVAQQQQSPQRECFTVVMNHGTGGGSLGAILVDQCTGKTWQLIRATLPRGASSIRWFPIMVETNEYVSAPAN
jgi:hypothetical protein